MDAGYRKVLRAALVDLYSGTSSVQLIGDTLFASGSISAQDLERFDSEQTSWEKMRLLLLLLMRKAEASFLVFMKCLEIHEMHLYTPLKELYCFVTEDMQQEAVKVNTNSRYCL